MSEFIISGEAFNYEVTFQRNGEIKQEELTVFVSTKKTTFCLDCGWTIEGTDFADCKSFLEQKMADYCCLLLSINSIAEQRVIDCCYGECNTDLLLTGSDY